MGGAALTSVANDPSVMAQNRATSCAAAADAGVDSTADREFGHISVWFWSLAHLWSHVAAGDKIIRGLFSG